MDIFVANSSTHTIAIYFVYNNGTLADQITYPTAIENIKKRLLCHKKFIRSNKNYERHKNTNSIYFKSSINK
jgi:hypothetical protein